MKIDKVLEIAFAKRRHESEDEDELIWHLGEERPVIRQLVSARTHLRLNILCMCDELQVFL